MHHDDKEKESLGSMFAEWMKSVSEPGYSSRMQDGWQALLRTWQTASLALSSPQTMEAILKGANALPETATRMVRTTWDGYFQLYGMWMKNVGKVGEASKAYSFEGVEPDTFKEWTAFYEKEIQPVLKMPQVGLTRIYQERANEAMDKFNRAQVAIGELLHMLSVPVEKSVRAVQEKIEEQVKEGKLSENFKDYYNMWIKIMEGHFMTLYQSPEWAQFLGRTMKVIGEFKVAQEGVLVDTLQSLPVPTNKDMDELYKEFYVLKKTVKAMAKKVKKLESLT